MSAGNIVLIGFMGAGKTVVGRCIAQRTGRKLIDVDEIVAGRRSINDIFATEGESGFRRREKEAIARVAKERGVVIATGGGAVLDPENVNALKRSGVVVYLSAESRELATRLNGTRDRPLLQSGVGELLTQRLPIYEAAADVRVTTDGKAPDAIADEIVSTMRRVRRVKVALDRGYNVVVGRGILGRMPELVRLPNEAERVCIVSHPRVRRLWGEALEAAIGLETTWATFPAGEQHKTLDTAARLLNTIGRAGLHRHDVIVALGGGVVGDVGAYVASTYARGIPVVQIPTTLLAMVDSSIGGKTGVNLPQGKNLVGTFHQPLGVIADLDVLSTLPRREMRNAMAEVIKYGFIADPRLIDPTALRLEDVVVSCAKIKAGVVAADEREAGPRAILNYGHTLGHAVEALSVAGKARKLHHGEAIAIGMVYAAAVAKLTGKPDLVDATRIALDRVGLPTSLRGAVSWRQVLDKMSADKKYSRGLRFVLLEKPGKAVVERVPAAILERAFVEVA